MVTGPELVALPGGTFTMGDERFYPEEGPVHEATVAPFAIGATTVTNRQFAAFVAATGYVSVAEREVPPGALPPGVPVPAPGSLVFTPTDGPVDLGDWRQWWRYVEGASWRAPHGPGSDLDGLDEHPVVQVSHEDAEAYAAWAGLRLPTEAEWEYAARGGLHHATYAWGEGAPDPEDLPANTWQGAFPWRSTGARGWHGTAPVRSFPPNGFGLFEVTGNTWEWTSTPWTGRHEVLRSCCPAPLGIGRGPAVERVIKGGSHLCSPDYCFRYRPAARSAQATDSATTHLGFRVAADG